MGEAVVAVEEEEAEEKEEEVGARLKHQSTIKNTTIINSSSCSSGAIYSNKLSRKR